MEMRAVHDAYLLDDRFVSCSDDTSMGLYHQNHIDSSVPGRQIFFFLHQRLEQMSAISGQGRIPNCFRDLTVGV